MQIVKPCMEQYPGPYGYPFSYTFVLQFSSLNANWDWVKPYKGEGMTVFTGYAWYLLLIVDFAVIGRKVSGGQQ